MNPDHDYEDPTRSSTTPNPLTLNHWSFFGHVSPAMKKAMVGGVSFCRRDENPKRNKGEEEAPPADSGDKLLLDPMSPVRLDKGALLFQETGRSPYRYWYTDPGSCEPKAAGQDILQKVVDRALFHNECPTCSRSLVLRSGGVLACMGAPMCVTKIFRRMFPPMGEPLWRVLKSQQNWSTLPPEKVLALTQKTLSMSDEVMEYLVYQFRPSVPGHHVSQWLKFLVKRQMCWGEGVRLRLFEEKKLLNRISRNKKKRSGNGESSDDQQDDTDDSDTE